MDDAVYVKVRTRDINYVNRIMEGYEYLGLVSTLDRQEGLLVIRVTPDTRHDVETILAKLPVPVQIIGNSE